MLWLRERCCDGLRLVERPRCREREGKRQRGGGGGGGGATATTSEQQRRRVSNKQPTSEVKDDAPKEKNKMDKEEQVEGEGREKLFVALALFDIRLAVVKLKGQLPKCLCCELGFENGTLSPGCLGCVVDWTCAFCASCACVCSCAFPSFPSCASFPFWPSSLSWTFCLCSCGGDLPFDEQQQCGSFAHWPPAPYKRERK